MAWKNSFDVNRILAFTALFISILTFIIFVRQTNIMDQQSHLSVLPYLILEYNTSEPDTLITVNLVNQGVGPAIISKRAFYYKEKTYEIEFRDFLEEQIPEMKNIRIISSATLENGFAIPAGGKREIIAVGGDSLSFYRFQELMVNLIGSEDFNYDLRYESIYGDTWSLQKGSVKPIVVEE